MRVTLVPNAITILSLTLVREAYTYCLRGECQDSDLVLPKQEKKAYIRKLNTEQLNSEERSRMLLDGTAACVCASPKLVGGSNFDSFASRQVIIDEIPGVVFQNVVNVQKLDLSSVSKPNVLVSSFFAQGPITATFDAPVSCVSFTGVGIGSAGLKIEAYDSAGTIVATDTYSSAVTSTRGFAASSAAGIASFVIRQINEAELPTNGDPYYVDDLVFCKIPEDTLGPSSGPTMSPTPGPSSGPTMSPSRARTLSDTTSAPTQSPVYGPNTADLDGDGVLNDDDICPNTSMETPIYFIPQPVYVLPKGDLNAGCSVDDICPCVRVKPRPWKSHDAYVKCVKRVANKLFQARTINRNQRRWMIVTRFSSECGNV